MGNAILSFAEVLCLFIALMCLLNEARGVDVFFLLCAMAAGSLKRHSLRKKFEEAEERNQAELDALRGELAGVRALASKAAAGHSAAAASSKQAAELPKAATPTPAPAEKVASIPAPVAEPPRQDSAPTTQPAPHAAASATPPTAAATVPQAKPAALFCTRCGETTRHNERYCPKCGGFLVSTAESTKAEAQAPAKDAAKPTPAAVPTMVPSPPTQTSPPRPSSPMSASTTASGYVPFRVPEPRPTFRERLRGWLALEEVLGTNWFAKLGGILLVIGVAGFGVWQLKQLGPVGKVIPSYAVAIALLAGGVFLERREHFRILGRTCIGGGWSLLFFTTYALHYVDAMKLISSASLDILLMLLVAAAMVGHTLRYRSQLVTGLAFLLAYSTVALGQNEVLSLAAGAVLAIALVAIVVKLQWFELEVFGILSSYLNHLYWLNRVLGVGEDHTIRLQEFLSSGQFLRSSVLLVLYWAAFRTSYVIRKIGDEHRERVSTVAALLNTFLLLGVMKFQSARPELAFYALLVLGAVEFTLGQMPVTKKRREAFVVLTLLGAALMLAAVPFRYTGYSVSVLWLVGGEVLLVAGILVGEKLFRRIGLVVGVLVGLHTLAFDLIKIVDQRQATGKPVTVEGILFALAAAVLYANACWLRTRWQDLFSDSFSGVLLRVHSYLGAIMASIACWALFMGDWTAVSLMAVVVGFAALSRVITAYDLQVQAGFLALGALIRVLAFNIHSEAPHGAHLKLRVLTLAIVAALYYVAANRSRDLRHIFAFCGTLCASLLIYTEVPRHWQPFAVAVFALALMESGRLLRYLTLSWHTHLLAVAGLYLGFTASFKPLYQWTGIRNGMLECLPLVFGYYLLSWRSRMSDDLQQRTARIAYTWAAAAMGAFALHQVMRPEWLPLGWMLYGVLLAVVSRRWKLPQLCFQEYALAAGSVIQALGVDYSTVHNVGGLNSRLLVYATLATALYLMSRFSTPRERHELRLASYLHTFAATGLLAWLAAFEAHDGWLAAVWILFALALAAADRKLRWEELPYQVHALALLSMARAIIVNLHSTAQWRYASVRLLSTSVVIVALYALTRVVFMREEWRKREIHHVYSWAASVLASLLIWYELNAAGNATGIAVAWALYGVVLFEYGFRRDIRQFRIQAYVALIASFVRIFFTNLAALSADPSSTLQLALLVIIAAIFFYVYWQLTSGAEQRSDAGKLPISDILAHAGTATVAALLYFRLNPSLAHWTVAAWASLGVLLGALALLTRREIFLQQLLVVVAAALGRGLFHNVYGGPEHGGMDWKALSAAIAIMLLGLPLAFRTRTLFSGVAVKRTLDAVIRRPEQLLFFVPVVLLTLMLGQRMTRGTMTAAWGIEGLLIFVGALVAGERSFRLTGIGILLLSVGKIVAVDAWRMESLHRWIAFIILGAALLCVSFLYGRYRDTIRQYL